jgi:hypothetical protein
MQLKMMTFESCVPLTTDLTKFLHLSTLWMLLVFAGPGIDSWLKTLLPIVSQIIISITINLKSESCVIQNRIEGIKKCT